jgi:hypothetical protein
LSVALVVAALFTALIGTGCSSWQVWPFGQKTRVLSNEEQLRLLKSSGLDDLQLDEFTKIDNLIKAEEYVTAHALLANLPRNLADTPPANYRRAYLATLKDNHRVAEKYLKKSKIGGGYLRGAAELQAYQHLLHGRGTQAAGICIDLLFRDPRRPLIWRYLYHAVMQDPLTQGVQGGVNALNQRYRKLPAVEVLNSVVIYAMQQNDGALDRMKKQATRMRNSVGTQEVYLKMLRTVGEWKSAAVVGTELAKLLEKDDPQRERLKEELESIQLAQLMNQSDPVPPAVDLRVQDGNLDNLEERVPDGVPLNNNDSRDGGPPDHTDADGNPLYFLPFKAGDVRYVGIRHDTEPSLLRKQLIDAEADHRAEHAYCFLMSEGTPILAARGGVVRRVRAQAHDLGLDEFDKVIEIQHRDGTIARYWHVARMGAAVNIGDPVYRGQVIGRSGHTGKSFHQVLRFEVVAEAPRDRHWWIPYRQWTTLPIHFADVTEEDGVPKEGRWCRSRNVWVPNVF